MTSSARLRRPSGRVPAGRAGLLRVIVIPDSLKTSRLCRKQNVYSSNCVFSRPTRWIVRFFTFRVAKSTTDRRCAALAPNLSSCDHFTIPGQGTPFVLLRRSGRVSTTIPDQQTLQHGHLSATCTGAMFFAAPICRGTCLSRFEKTVLYHCVCFSIQSRLIEATDQHQGSVCKDLLCFCSTALKELVVHRVKCPPLT